MLRSFGDNRRRSPNIVLWSLALANAVLLTGLLIGSALAEDLPNTPQQTANYRCVIEELDRVAEFSDPGPEILYIRGRSLQALGRYSLALLAYDALLEEDPDHAAASSCRAAAKDENYCPEHTDPRDLLSDWLSRSEFDDTEKGRYRRAERAVDRLHATDAAGAWSGLDSAIKAAMEQGYLYRALVLHDRALRLEPESAYHLAGRGYVLAAQGKHQAAVDALTKAIDVMPSREALVSRLVRRLKGPQDLAGQQEQLNLPLYFPHGDFVNLVFLHEARARAFAKTGRLEQARADYQNVLQMVPQHHEAQRALAEIESRMESREPRPVEPALVPASDREVFDHKLYRRLVVARFGPVDPNATPASPDSARQRGKDYMRRGMYDLAGRYFRMETDAHPKSTFAWLQLGQALYAAGDYDAALIALGKIDEGAERSDGFQNATVERAVLKWRMGRTDEAVADVSSVIDAYSPTDRATLGKADQALALRGLLYTEIGRYDLAVIDLREASDYLPGSSRLFHDLSGSLAMNGALGEALANVIRAIELSPRFVRAYQLKALIHFALARHESPDIELNDCAPSDK